MTNLKDQSTTPSLTVPESAGPTNAVNESDISYSNDDLCLTKESAHYEEFPGTSLIFVPLACYYAHHTPKNASDDTTHHICSGCEKWRKREGGHHYTAHYWAIIPVPTPSAVKFLRPRASE